MDQTGQAFTLQGPDGRKWVGRIIVAVILGEAIWNLIVSIMNNVIVPWLGDFFGQSSGLPTSFTQRPYNYPDLFVSVVEFCIAGLVAAIFNYFLERRGSGKIRTMKVPVSQKAEDVQVVSQPAPGGNPSYFANESSSAGGKAKFDQSCASRCVFCSKPFARSCPAIKPSSDNEACGSAGCRSTSHVVGSEGGVCGAKD